MTSLGILALATLLFFGVRDLYTPEPAGRAACSKNCTVYASPAGSDTNSGLSPSSPKTFLGAAAAARAGYTVCLLPGTYSLSSSFLPPASGTPSEWIVYKSCGNGAAELAWTGPADAESMIKIGDGKFPSAPAYLEFRGLELDGRGNALDGFFCTGSHHLRFIENTITDTGGAGIASVTCDYLTADGNRIYHNGYIPASTRVPQWYSWTSGISFNSDQWFDRYPGFHNIIANNIVAGEVDQSPKRTDGNGIILDLSNRTYDYGSANTPPALVINNVVYGNGGHCIEAYTVTNFWIVNNTCFKNGLDTAMKSPGSITVNNARDGFVINNIAVPWRATNPSYDEENNVANVRYFANLFYGGPVRLKNEGAGRFIEADPWFANPPYFDSKSERAYERAPAPSALNGALTLRNASRGLRKGIDPATLPGLPPAIVTGLKRYFYTDIRGNPRPPGGPIDLGAYQSSGSR
jgi:hypothetical protein